MIRIMNDIPTNVAGFKAVGKVEADDYKKVLIPALDAHVLKEGKINFLLVLENSLSDFSIGALLQDLGVGIKHLSKWHKMAIVSDSGAINSFTDAFSYVAPGEAKGFKHSELDAAISWVSN